MIYITGDTHIPIDINKLSTKNFPDQKDLRKRDVVIICGDFGGVWDGSKEELYWLNWLDDKNFTTLFVDGNHENHRMLNDNYNVENYYGGKVHRLKTSIYHLMRGETYTIDGKVIFAMGGAESHDKAFRKEGETWWAEELPNESEYQNAIENLSKHDWNVDYVVTHCCPDSIQDKIAAHYKHDKLTNFFEHVVKTNCQYTKWYFGHYHQDRYIDERHICLYNKIAALN